MTSSRRTLFAAVAAVAVALACSTSPEAHAAAIDDDVFRTLPPQAEAVMGVNVATLRTSFLYDRFLERSDMSDIDEWARSTGFDPRRDIESVAGAMWGEPSAESSLFVLRGRFDLNQEAQSQLQEVGNHRGVAIYTGPADKELTFAFPEDGVALLGTQAEVVNGIERRLAGGPSLMDNAGLTARAAEASGYGQVWFVSSAPGAVAQALPDGLDANQARLLKILAGMRDSIAALDLLQGVRVRLSGTAQSAEDATTLAEAARGMVALARITLPEEQRDLMQYLDRVEIAAGGDRFEASFALDRFEVEQLLEKMTPPVEAAE